MRYIFWAQTYEHCLISLNCLKCIERLEYQSEAFVIMAVDTSHTLSASDPGNFMRVDLNAFRINIKACFVVAGKDCYLVNC
jgi:hypothetical protein